MIKWKKQPSNIDSREGHSIINVGIGIVILGGDFSNS